MNIIKELWHGNIILQRGYQNELQRDERASRIYGKASREFREKLHGRTERNFRKVPRLLERVHEPCRSIYL